MSIDSCSWSTSFPCMVSLHELLIINHYDLTLHFSVKSPDPETQNLAFDRLKFWLQNIVPNSIMIHDQSTGYEKFRELHQNNFIELPVEPVDYYFVQALWAKLNRITNGHIGVSAIELTSDLSDGVCFLADGSEIDILDQDGVSKKQQWWHSDTPKTNSVQDYTPWKQFGLDFGAETLTKTRKPARIIKVKNFKPILVKPSEN